ncbi:tetratricopeptide repeat protein [Umezawaea sp. Da 62-37]|uniref:tetratricopeptide repeat protein n=1 Tax=Umezawaea sp. Da 62-37 TaxID=3075927 RepID=UPI0028F6D329|nr:tetratricopeptide repeat protein [Umezawaea sp. Da 62-37]WNV89776.1 tetratricopeptide repeat protein [Umezawaea sp. Da 62-37]
MKTRTVALLLTAVLAVYFVMLGGKGVLLITTGDPAAVGLGIGVLILPLIGIWIAWTNLRFGLKTEKMARQLADEGELPDTTSLPRRPSGRVDRDAADAYFEERRVETEAAPDDWRSWFRLAQAYDLAGDRGRARDTMRKAIQLYP